MPDATTPQFGLQCYPFSLLGRLTTLHQTSRSIATDQVVLPHIHSGYFVCVCRFYRPILIKCDMRQLAKWAAHPASCCHLHVPVALYEHKLLRGGEGNLHYCQLSLHVSAMHVLRASLFSTYKRYVTHNADVSYFEISSFIRKFYEN